MMAFSLLRGSRFFRSLVLTVGVFSFLLWLYIVMRIVFNDVDVNTPFVDSVPSISFSILGAFSFGLCALATFVYLWLWGRFNRSTEGRQRPDERTP